MLPPIPAPKSATPNSNTDERLRQANEALRENNALLRSALAEGVADAALINEAMQAELEALSAQQSADAAEVEAILTELRPIVQEAR